MKKMKKILVFLLKTLLVITLALSAVFVSFVTFQVLNISYYFGTAGGITALASFFLLALFVTHRIQYKNIINKVDRDITPKILT
jgi:uncharacterized membrane protein